MSRSQNGWPVVDAAACDTAPLFAGVSVPNGVLRGDVAVVFRWLAERYHHTVEPLVPGTCWGWYVKMVEGSTTISNHASATAVDLNASQHAMGTDAWDSFTAAQIKACHAIVAASGGVLRWGGDYTGRPDPMHWEINDDEAAVHTFATTIRGTQMSLTAAEIDAIADKVIEKLNTRDGVFRAPSWRKDKTNVEWPFEDVFTTVYEKDHEQGVEIISRLSLISMGLNSALVMLRDLTTPAPTVPPV